MCDKMVKDNNNRHLNFIIFLQLLKYLLFSDFYCEANWKVVTFHIQIVIVYVLTKYIQMQPTEEEWGY